MFALKMNNTQEMLKKHGTSKPASNGRRAAASPPSPPK
jgi:hypothetical protein